MRDSCIFYRSFYEAIVVLDREQKANLYDAIFEYSLNGNSIELSGVEKTIFTLIKPQLDANNKKFLNGKLGGKPKQNETKNKPKTNQKESTSKANVNDNVNDNANVTEKEYRKFKHLCISFDEVEKLKENYTISQIDGVLDSIENYRLNKNYVSLYLTAKKWLEKEYPNAKNNPHPNGIGKTNQKLMTYDD